MLNVGPKMVEFYQPQKRQEGRPSKEPLDPYKEIPKNTHLSALTITAAFEESNINCDNNLLKQLKEGYGWQDIKLGHNKVVKIATSSGSRRSISIPHGTIKSAPARESAGVVRIFQFHMVRLKEGEGVCSGRLLRFQFHMVRLKAQMTRKQVGLRENFNSIWYD